MQKIEYIVDVTVKNNRVSRSKLIGYTNPALVDLDDNVVFKAFKPLTHDFVRTQVIAAYGITNASVRIKIKKIVTAKRMEITVKLVSVNELSNA